MLVTDRHVAGGEDALVHKVGEAADGGVNVVQLREKDLDRLRLSTDQVAALDRWIARERTGQGVVQEAGGRA